MKHSPHRPQSLMQPIEQCVMQINEHENKSCLPNYQIPPCAPASAYTAVNANEAFLAARQLFESVQGDQRMASMLGDLGDLDLHCSTRSRCECEASGKTEAKCQVCKEGGREGGSECRKEGGRESGRGREGGREG